jgi:hypothetical protein
MANYLSLEEAAAKLGISTERLIDLRSQGQVRGFRDGASWKFPDSEIERLQDEPDLLTEGSGVLVSDAGSAGSGNIIGGDESEPGGGSDVDLGSEPLQTGSGSDVNLVASASDGSDVAVVANANDLDFESSEDLLEIDSGELQLQDPALDPDASKIDLAIEPNAGSTGPVTDAELKEISESHPDVLAPEPGDSDLDLSVSADEDDSGEDLLGEDSGMDALSDASPSPGAASSLELMDDLDVAAGSGTGSGSGRGADVLSELDLLSAEQEGSGLISGDSENLLASSGLGSSIGADAMGGSDLSALDDDALADDDDLVIADDDDDLMISSEGSDISVAGDSGINLMSPSDSGLSLESEPLDLAGSSISALDLGAELSEGGSSGSGVGSGSGDGSAVDFQADEEFQLSPSGLGLEADIESGSQVIEVEDSDAIAEPVEFEDAGFGDDAGLGGDVFGEEQEAGGVSDALELDESEPVADDMVGPVRGGGYEVPFTLLQCVTLVMILFVLCLGGILMTDLVRNMWAYSEPAAPVSSLTNSLIGLMGWN